MGLASLRRESSLGLFSEVAERWFGRDDLPELGPVALVLC